MLASCREPGFTCRRRRAGALGLAGCVFPQGRSSLPLSFALPSLAPSLYPLPCHRHERKKTKGRERAEDGRRSKHAQIGCAARGQDVVEAAPDRYIYCGARRDADKGRHHERPDAHACQGRHDVNHPERCRRNEAKGQKIAESVLVEALLQFRDERSGAFSGDVREHGARREEDDTRPGGGAKQNEDDAEPAEQSPADKRERRRDGKREGDNDNIEQHEGDGRNQEPVLDRGLEVAIVGGNGLPAQALVPAEPEEGHKPEDKHHGQPKSF